MPYVNPQPKTINTYEPNGTGTYSITFEYELDTDVWVGVYDTNKKKFERVLQDDAAYPWTLETATTIKFTNGDPGVNVIIYRSTDINEPISEFYTGSAIRAQDLNDNFEQLLFAAQELTDQTIGLNGVNNDLQDQIDDINDIIQDLVGVEILKDVPALNAFVPDNLETPIQVLDSTDWSSALNVQGTPTGFLGDSDLRVNLRTSSLSPIEYVFISYVSANPDGRYVNRSGDDMSGNLTFDTDKIQLKTDGSATFSGTVFNTGSFVVDRDDGSKGIISGRLNGVTTSTINADGSATFDSRVDIGTNTLTDNVALKLENNYTSAATLYVQNYNDAGDVFSGRKSDNFETSRIGADGSAQFGGSDYYNKFYASGTHEIYNKDWTSLSSNSNALQIINSEGVAATIFGDGSASFAGGITADNIELAGPIKAAGGIELFGPNGSYKVIRGGVAPDTETFSIFGDGSASFANSNVLIYNNGAVDAFRASSDAGPIFNALSGADFASRTSVAQINNDGSAKFTSDKSNIELNNDYAIQVYKKSSDSNDYCYALFSDVGTPASQKISFFADGKALFQGIVETKGGIKFPDGTTQTTAGGGGGGTVGSLQQVTDVGNNTTNDISIGTAAFRSFDKFKDLIEFIPAELIRNHADAIAAMDLDQAFSLDAIADQPFRTAIENITRTTDGKINLNADGTATFMNTVNFGPFDLSNVEGRGVEVRPDGNILIQRRTSQSSNSILDGRLGNVQTVNILASGNATFGRPTTADGGTEISPTAVWIRPADASADNVEAFGVYSGGFTGANSTVSIKKEGSAKFKGNQHSFGEYAFDSDTTFGMVHEGGSLTTQRALSSGDAARAYGHRYGKDIKIEFFNNGSATFEGNVVVNNSSGSRSFIDGFGIYQSDVSGNNIISLLNDGSATFAGGINTSDSYANTSGMRIDNNGAIAVQRPGVSDTVFAALEKKTTTIEFKASGSAKFASYIESTRHSGVRTFLNGELLGTSYGFLIKNDPADTVVASIGIDGSATFARSALDIFDDSSSDSVGTLRVGSNWGSAAQPAAAFGYGLGGSFVPTSQINRNGAAVFNGEVSSNLGALALRDNSLENHRDDADNANVAVSYYGFQKGTTRFRDFMIFNGRAGLIASFEGSTNAVKMNGQLEVVGGIKFNDGTVQTTAATGGGTNYWSDNGSAVFPNNSRNVVINLTNFNNDGFCNLGGKQHVNTNGYIHFNRAIGVSNILNADNSGTIIEEPGTIIVSRNGNACLFVNRRSSQGNILSFNFNGSEKGSFSIGDGYLNYNGQLGSRSLPSLGLTRASFPDIPRGTVLCGLDQSTRFNNEDQLDPRTAVSTVIGDKCVAGVFNGWNSNVDEDTGVVSDEHISITTSGVSVIRISSAATVQCGDLLESAGDGTAQPQDDDIIRSKTIGKVIGTRVIEQFDDGSYLVPCRLMLN